jgi:hypothetical protein
MNRSNLVMAAALAPLAVVLQTTSAHAYLDPGTGSMLLQGLLGGIAGGAVIVKIYWARIKSFFRRGSAGKDAPGGAA